MNAVTDVTVLSSGILSDNIIEEKTSEVDYNRKVGDITDREGQKEYVRCRRQCV